MIKILLDFDFEKLVMISFDVCHNFTLVSHRALGEFTNNINLQHVYDVLP